MKRYRTVKYCDFFDHYVSKVSVYTKVRVNLPILWVNVINTLKMSVLVFIYFRVCGKNVTVIRIIFRSMYTWSVSALLLWSKFHTNYQGDLYLCLNLSNHVLYISESVLVGPLAKKLAQSWKCMNIQRILSEKLNINVESVLWGAYHTCFTRDYW